MKVPPAPVGTPFGTFPWADWYYKITYLINNALINHNDLQGMQGGSTTERYHLTLAEYTRAKAAMTIKLIQRGTISIGPGLTSATLAIPTTVDPTKSELRLLGWSSSAGAVAVNADQFPRIDLTNATTITIKTGGTTGATVTASWEIIEYN